MAVVAGYLGDGAAFGEGALLLDHDGRIKGIGFSQLIADLNHEKLVIHSAAGWLSALDTLLLDTTPRDRKDGTVYIYGGLERKDATQIIASGISRVVYRSHPGLPKVGIPILVAKEIRVDEVTGDLSQHQGEKEHENNSTQSENKGLPDRTPQIHDGDPGTPQQDHQTRVNGSTTG